MRSSVPARSITLFECPLKIKDIPPKAKVHIEVTISLRQRQEGNRKKGIIDVINHLLSFSLIST